MDAISTVYDINLQHILATNGQCPLSFVKRLLHPFCFLLTFSKLKSAEIFPVLFFKPSSAKLPIFICLTSLLHSTLVRSLLFYFRKYSTGLSIIEADKNGWRQLRNFGRPLCPFRIRFVFISQWDRVLATDIMFKYRFLYDYQF